MKSFSRWLFLAAVLLAFPGWMVAWAGEPETVVLEVPGMSCPACPITVRMALRKVPGVRDVQVDFDARTATVTFDPDVASVSSLEQATAEAGYPSRLRPTSP